MVRRLRIIGICCWIILMSLMFSGCGSSAVSSLPDNEEIKAAQDEVPFTILLPRYLPDGYTFSQIQVVGPPPGIQQKNPRYTASLVFGNGDEGYLEITESNFAIQISDYTDVIELSETTTAELKVWELPDGRTMLALAFSSNEVGIMVSAAELSQSEIIKVAESLLKD